MFDEETEELWLDCVTNALAVFATEHAFKATTTNPRLSEHEEELVQSGVGAGVAGTITALRDKGMLKLGH